MTREKMIEALAKAIYCTEGSGRLPAPWTCAGDVHEKEWAFLRNEYEKSAAAVLDLCGPKPLVWLRGSAMGAIARYTVAQSDFDDGYGEIWYILIDNKTAGKLGQFSTEESAQAAAQSHADAAHWANTGMGDLIGGK